MWLKSGKRSVPECLKFPVFNVTVPKSLWPSRGRVESHRNPIACHSPSLTGL